MAGDRFSCCFVQALNVTNVGYIGLDKLTSGSNVLGRKFLLFDDLVEMLVKALLDLVSEKLGKRFV